MNQIAQAQWRIVAEHRHRMIRLTLSGLFTLDDVARMDHERRSKIGSLRCGYNRHLALCDVRDTCLSTPEVATALQIAIGNPLFRAKRCAMIVSSALARIQARRVVNRADVAWFEEPGAAEAWLLQPDQARMLAQA